MFSKAFWLAALERAVKSFAGAVLAFWGVGAVPSLDVTANWGQALTLGLGAAIASILLSLTSSAVTQTPGPSLINAEVLNP